MINVDDNPSYPKVVAELKGSRNWGGGAEVEIARLRRDGVRPQQLPVQVVTVQALRAKERDDAFAIRGRRCGRGVRTDRASFPMNDALESVIPRTDDGTATKVGLQAARIRSCFKSSAPPSIDEAYREEP